MSSSIPGFDAPAVGFEQPFEMLTACHDRVRGSLALLGRLIEHVDAHGHDNQSRSAAADVLRYFDLAAPLHHQDEELHVFPLLIGSGEADLVAAVATLLRDHAQMETLWRGLRTTLAAWALPGAAAAIDSSLRQQAAAFDAVYASHLQTEEGQVFPAARARIGVQRLAAMSADMQQRRRAAPPAAT